MKDSIQTVIKSMIDARMKVCLSEIEQEMVSPDIVKIEHMYDDDSSISDQSTMVDFKSSVILDGGCYDIKYNQDFVCMLSEGNTPLPLVILIQIYLKMNNDIIHNVIKIFTKLERFDLLQELYRSFFQVGVFIVESAKTSDRTSGVLVASHIGSLMGKILIEGAAAGSVNI